MAEDDPGMPGKPVHDGRAAQRAARSASALRANLKRRKLQARERGTPDTPSNEQSPDARPDTDAL